MSEAPIDVSNIPVSQLTDADIDGIAELLCAVWPSPQRGPAAVRGWLMGERDAFTGPSEDAPRKLIASRNGKVVAAASIAPRTIATSSGRLVVGALGGVMSHPDVRGLGYGKAVVLAAFEHVRRSGWACALFQTGDARAFYEALGCRVVTNPIVNSLNKENPKASPLWDRFAMCWPGDTEWPEGEIDLLGPAY